MSYSIAEHAILKAISSEDRLIFRHIKNKRPIQERLFCLLQCLVHLQQQLATKLSLGCLSASHDTF